ncbi:hypothetical protein NLC26_03300 [Candidatus Aminicenantes bacterium AC-708-M15]|nr:hypothetical protein [SCandidatus Aminicenantes bacterium Aminicenantia_JdfR_composite]MCP2604490.1 hypothetical protein [Candidatus Aminicenantes bacterium AC-708-M15]MCP2620454.1 hypothetical protein [Candidatus Aminicenantes bacterium AC-334-E05]
MSISKFFIKPSMMEMIHELTKSELNNLKEYVNTLEALLEKEVEDFKEYINAQAEKMTKKEQEEFFDIYYDQYQQLKKVFPNIMRSSFFVTIYTLLEYKLIFICNYYYLCKKLNLPDPSTLKKEKGIFRARKYLKKHVKVSFPDGHPSWRKIRFYNLLRNFIVHNFGRLNDSKKAKKLETFIEKSSKLSLDCSREIWIDKSFCFDVITTIENFFEELFKNLRDKENKLQI